MGIIMSTYNYLIHLYYRALKAYNRLVYPQKEYLVDEALAPAFGPPGALDVYRYHYWPTDNDAESSHSSDKNMFPDTDSSGDLKSQFEHSSSEDTITPPIPSPRKSR